MNVFVYTADNHFLTPHKICSSPKNKLVN